jgi:hypothetical protein
MNPSQPSFLSKIQDVFYNSNNLDSPKRDFDWKKVEIKISQWDGNENLEKSRFKITVNIPSRDLQFTFGRNGVFERISTNNSDIEYHLNSTMDSPVLSHLNDLERIALALKKGSCLVMDIQALKPLKRSLTRMGFDQETDIEAKSFGTYFDGRLGKGGLVSIPASFVHPVESPDGIGYNYSLSNSNLKGEKVSRTLYKTPEELLEAMIVIKKANEDLAKKDSKALKKDLDFLGDMVGEMRRSGESMGDNPQRLLGNVSFSLSTISLYQSYEAADDSLSPCLEKIEYVELNLETVSNSATRGAISFHINADSPSSVKVRLFGSINNEEVGIPLEWLFDAHKNIASNRGEAFVQNARRHLVATSPNMEEVRRSTSFMGCHVLRRSREVLLKHFC